MLCRFISYNKINFLIKKKLGYKRKNCARARAAKYSNDNKFIVTIGRIYLDCFEEIYHIDHS